MRWLSASIAVVACLVPGGPSVAGDGSPAATAPAARITLRPAFPVQGDPLLVDVRVPAGTRPAGGTFLGKPLRFFRWGEGAFRALVPISVRTDPGDHPLSVTLDAGGTTASVTRNVTVAAGDFETSKLHVNPRFTHPPRRYRRRIHRDHRHIRRAFHHASNERLWHGSFEKPLEGRTTDPYGVRRVYNGRLKSRHLGLDIDADTGDPIHAAADGRVVLAEHLYYSGNTVILDHGLGLYTVYFHMSELDVDRGDHVAKGDVLGKAGATGRATGPHLHFGVKLEGTYVSPERLLSLAMSDDPELGDGARAASP